MVTIPPILEYFGMVYLRISGDPQLKIGYRNQLQGIFSGSSCSCRRASSARENHKEISNSTLPSSKRTVCYGKSPFLMGKSTISMTIFNSKLLVYQKVSRLKSSEIHLRKNMFCNETKDINWKSWALRLTQASGWEWRFKKRTRLVKVYRQNYNYRWDQTKSVIFTCIMWILRPNPYLEPAYLPNTFMTQMPFALNIHIMYTCMVSSRMGPMKFHGNFQQHVNIFQSLPNTRISMWVQLSGPKYTAVLTR